MLSNYLTIALRNLRRNLGYTAINLVGLAVGLAACLLIGLYVRHELSYDNFYENADRIHQVIYGTGDGSLDRTAPTPIPLREAMQGQFSQIERLVRLKEITGVVRQGTSSWTEDVLYADSGFFQMFSFPLIRGEPGDVLSSPGSVVLTAETARQLFGTTDVVGRPLRVRLRGTFYDYTVTGVAEAPPSTSSIQFGVVAPFQKYAQVDRAHQSPSWGFGEPGQPARISGTAQRRRTECSTYSVELRPRRSRCSRKTCLSAAPGAGAPPRRSCRRVGGPSRP